MHLRTFQGEQLAVWGWVLVCKQPSQNKPGNRGAPNLLAWCGGSTCPEPSQCGDGSRASPRAILPSLSCADRFLWTPSPPLEYCLGAWQQFAFHPATFRLPSPLPPLFECKGTKRSACSRFLFVKNLPWPSGSDTFYPSSTHFFLAPPPSQSEKFDPVQQPLRRLQNK